VSRICSTFSVSKEQNIFSSEIALFAKRFFYKIKKQLIIKLKLSVPKSEHFRFVPLFLKSPKKGFYNFLRQNFGDLRDEQLI